MLAGRETWAVGFVDCAVGCFVGSTNWAEAGPGPEQACSAMSRVAGVSEAVADGGHGVQLQVLLEDVGNQPQVLQVVDTVH